MTRSSVGSASRDQVRVAEDGVAPDLEDELGAEVLPDVDVLEAVPVGPVERVVGRPADIVRDRPGRLADRVAGPDASIGTIDGSPPGTTASRSRIPRVSSSGNISRMANDA